MELDWNEYASGIKIRRWDSEAGEHKSWILGLT